MTNYHYRPPPDKRVACNIRIPRSLRLNLLAIMRLWQLIALREGDNPDAIDLTYVIEQLLREAANEVWGQTKEIVGHEGVPRSDGTWEKVKANLGESLHDAASRPALPEDSRRGRSRRKSAPFAFRHPDAIRAQS